MGFAAVSGCANGMRLVFRSVLIGCKCGLTWRREAAFWAALSIISFPEMLSARIPKNAMEVFVFDMVAISVCIRVTWRFGI